MRTLTDHHRVPSSYGGTRSKDNIIRLTENTHRALHTVMENLTPVRQHERLLKKINAQVHSTDFFYEMSTLLNKYKGYNELYAYKNGVLVPEKFLEAQSKF